MKKHTYKTLGAVVDAMMLEGQIFYLSRKTLLAKIFFDKTKSNPFRCERDLLSIGWQGWKDWQVHTWKDDLDKNNILCRVSDFQEDPPYDVIKYISHENEYGECVDITGVTWDYAIPLLTGDLCK